MKTEISYNPQSTQLVIIDGHPYLLQPAYYMPSGELNSDGTEEVWWNAEAMREEIQELLDAIDEGDYDNFFENKPEL